MFRYLFLIFLISCTTVNFQPIKTINKIDESSGYRVMAEIEKSYEDGTLIILMFSGGGTRAAALAYGVLEVLNKQTLKNPNSKSVNFLENVDLVFGVSGGSVLATYFSLYGVEVIPKFKEKFLKNDFQSKVIKGVFSNLSRLNSSEFGRGDILQEQLNLQLYQGKTFDYLRKNRKGPFAIISATDMNLGRKVIFTQEFFDRLCVDISDLQIARAVAASSSVPLIFTPLTFNNYGGNCNFSLPKQLIPSLLLAENSAQKKNINRLKSDIAHYADSKNHPYIHLVDGGLTDNLGLSSLLDIFNVAGKKNLYERLSESKKLKKIIVISVNAQNETKSDIDKSPETPATSEIINTIINVPIDRNTEATLNYFRRFVDEWNEEMKKKPQDERIIWHFVSLNLKDLPPSPLRDEVLNIPTSFYLPEKEIKQLRQAAQILMDNSLEYQRAVNN